jgi:KaiC/GvpD/RAD55 family RecA-like ATPase
LAERRLLASCIKSRTAFDRVADHITPGDLTEQGQMILTHASRYYERDPKADYVDLELLLNGICRELPNPKHHRAFKEIVDGLAAEGGSPENIVADYIAVIREKVGNQLATALAAGRPPDDVRPLVEKYADLLSTETLEHKEAQRVLIGQSVTELVAARNRDGGLIRIYPRVLNERLDGGLLRGHHVVVFARPEVGKTTFLVNAAYGFLQQNLRVLYVGNEDPIEDVVLRTVSRLADLTRHEVLDDPERADKLAREHGYESLVLASLTPGTPKEIEALVLEHKPDVVMVDQLRNLMVGEENFTRQLERAAQAVRAIGKRHNALMISVTQAGDSASGKSILDMGDVDSSNTGIPAQADVMIGIGMSREDEMMGRRVLSLPKNKAGGNHDAFPVRVDLAKSKVLSS